VVKLLVNREYGFRIQPARFPCLWVPLFSVNSDMFVLNIRVIQQPVLIAKNINPTLHVLICGRQGNRGFPHFPFSSGADEIYH
jgi:hypothetical protein